MIRIFVPDPLGVGAVIALSEVQSRYLTQVMRLSAGVTVALFNGRDGEALGLLRPTDGRRGAATLEITAPSHRPFQASPDLELVVALVKRPRLETIVEKAAELGARRVRLAITERTKASRANLERLQAIAVEASEQTGRLDVPVIDGPRQLDAILDGWPTGRRLMFCDEAGDAAPAGEGLLGAPRGPWAILIGPEDGFSPAERERIRAVGAVTPVSLGPRIMRADTAAIAAMSLWQALLGDWRGP